ncbi:MAG: ATP-binding protein [Clostridiales bacterium]|nr:ATP-binding protein [Clostridiales bacterium]
MSLTNTQYDEIMRSYQDRQLRRQHLIASRKEEIASLSPRMTELNAEIAHRSVSRARRFLDGDGAALVGARDEISALSAEKARLLLSLGYPADYLEPPYTCPDCRDTGYIGNERCHCLAQASIDLVYAQSNLSSILEEENFATFSLKYYDDSLFDSDTGISSLAAARNACGKCRQFVKQFDTEYQNILLFGDTGVGKTFLSHCIAKELLDSGHSVIYFSAQQFFDRLAEHAFRKESAAASDYRNIFKCDLLIIDDLGTEMTNSFTSSQFFVCLNERILRRRSTLISSNLNLQDIASIYSERIFSRITSDFMLLHLFGRDIRIQKTF